MRAKLLLAAALLAILFVSAQDGGIPYEIIHNCQDAGYNQCEYVVGQIYSFEEAPAEGLLVTFPENPLPKQLTGCAEDKAVTLAVYTDGRWTPITSEVIANPEGIQVQAYIDYLGDFAIIKKVPQTGFSEGETCTPLACGDTGSFITEPYNLYKVDKGPNAGLTLPTAKEGSTVSFDFCGMLAGCKVNPNKICDSAEQTQLGENHCQQGVAPDCAANYGEACTKEEDQCCYPARGDGCDPDCYIEKNEAGVITLSTDPDCFEGSDDLADKQQEEVLISVEPRPKGNDWKDESRDVNAILTGPVRFHTRKGDDPSRQLWYRNFQYQDFNDEWHYLIPTAQWPIKLTIGDFADGTIDDGFDSNEIGLFWRNPSAFLQSHGDYTKSQFWFLNTPVKKISWQAHSANCDDSQWCEGDDDDIPGYEVFYTKIKDAKFDPDNDGASSGIDCNDNNPNIYPGAPELCNGVDDNCNSYVTNTDTESLVDSILFQSERRAPGGEDDIGGSRSYMMPCDGYIDIKQNDGYIEIKRIDADTRADPILSDDGSRVLKESFSWPAYFGFKPELFDNDYAKMAEFLGYGDINRLPKDFQERNEYYSEPDIGGFIPTHNFFSWQTGCEVLTAAIKPICQETFFDSSFGMIDNKCFIGMESSCPCTHKKDPGCDPCDFPGEESYGSCTSEDDWIGPIFSRPGGRLLLKGDIIKMLVASEGVMDIDVHCYGAPGAPQKQDSTKIDEGCTPKKVQVHVCAKDTFSMQERKCFGKELCTTEVDETTTSIAENPLQAHILAKCPITITSDMKGGEQFPFYTYVCPEGKDCYKFYESKFQVCSTKELCYNNIDDDCDGLVDRQDTECQGACYEGECDIVNKKFCANSEWKTEDYCRSCGQADSSCSKSCAPEETSCEGGCKEGACDTAADLVCTNGAWTQSNYATKCKPKDSELSSSCEEEACDTQYNKTCLSGRWLADKTVCVRGCGPNDASCYFERQELAKEPYCDTGTCDIYENKYCTAQHEWTGASYCNYCGAIDSDCGAKSCTETITLGDGTKKDNCDYVSQKYCKSGQWLTAGYCALENCGLDSLSQTICGCTATATKEENELCLNGIDDDCDGFKDCADPDCPKDLPGCSCESGEEKNCYADPLNHFGLCEENSGKLACTNGAWGTCTDAFAPEIEVCNSFDDDCDGTEDEGCGGCKTGETRNCGADRGICGAGVQECDETGHWSICFGTGYSRPEIEKCGDGKDNDCNGETDEGCGCTEGAEQQCGTDVGECKFGTQKCTVGTWGACLGGVTQITEIGSQCLDGKDNDCDGKTDSQDENCRTTPKDELTPLCYDRTKNGDEDEVDCGGSTCQPCSEVSCNDRQQNGDEDGVDCGGSRGCPPCKEKKTTKVSASEKGKEAVEAKTDEVPEGAGQEKFPWVYIAGAIIVVAGLLFLLYNKFGKKQEPRPQKRLGIIPAGPTLAKPTVRPQQKPVRERITKSSEESILEKSFEEAKGLFKK